MKSTYRDKVVNGICQGAKNYIKNSDNLETGFGPTIIGEWSAADTDCALWLNNVGQGSRWDGTYYDTDGNIATKACPKCSCKYRNEASIWPAGYQQFLSMYVDAQIDAFSGSYGSFFWNFKVEEGSEPHWSYFDLVVSRNDQYGHLSMEDSFYTRVANTRKKKLFLSHSGTWSCTCQYCRTKLQLC
jgi:aryl-phospho-beta-D-glucosidase BglC (GH1 family)